MKRKSKKSCDCGICRGQGEKFTFAYLDEVRRALEVTAEKVGCTVNDLMQDLAYEFLSPKGANLDQVAVFLGVSHPDDEMKVLRISYGGSWQRLWGDLVDLVELGLDLAMRQAHRDHASGHTDQP